MIYIEFISREPTVPREIFRYIADQSTSWVQSDRDLYIGQLGRTMRIGPHPPYMTFFRVSGLPRLQEWEEYFLSDEYYHNHRSFAMQRSLQMVRDGCYDEIVETQKIAAGLYYLEFFVPEGNHSHIEACFRNRTNGTGGELVMLLCRIGLLAPRPGGIAGIRFDDHDSLEKFVRAAPREDNIEVEDAGLYRRFGSEIQ